MPATEYPLICARCGQLGYYEFGMLQCYEMAGRRSPPCKVPRCNGQMLHISELWDELRQRNDELRQRNAADHATQDARVTTLRVVAGAFGFAGFVFGLILGLGLSPL